MVFGWAVPRGACPDSLEPLKFGAVACCFQGLSPRPLDHAAFNRELMASSFSATTSTTTVPRLNRNSTRAGLRTSLNRISRRCVA